VQPCTAAAIEQHESDLAAERLLVQPHQRQIALATQRRRLYGKAETRQQCAQAIRHIAIDHAQAQRQRRSQHHAGGHGFAV
jgi:hypothetical protein